MSEAVPGAPVFEAVARLHDLPEQSLTPVVLSTGEKVCLIRTTVGICALADRCSHRDFPLSAGEVTSSGLVECAWHGAQFDPVSGVMLTGPGGDDVKTYTVRIDADTILIAPTGTA